MLNTTDERLVETVIHELVHATVFVDSQPDFNEGAANFVGEEAVVLFYSQPESARLGASPPTSSQSGTSGTGTGLAASSRARVNDDRLIAQAMMSLRDEIAQLYAEGLDAPLRAQKRLVLEASGREQLAALALTSRDADRVSKSARINDACLAIQGTYVADTSRHRAVFEELRRSLPHFIVRLRDAAEQEDPRRAFFAQ